MRERTIKWLLAKEVAWISISAYGDFWFTGFLRKRVANLTSYILNPFLVGFILILLLSLKATATPLDAAKWVLISVVICILPVLLAIVYLVRKQKLGDLFINIREQRTKIYLLAGVFVSIGCIILPYLGAPPLLKATFVAGLSAVAIFMGINLLWKISLHAAFMTASVTVLVILYGPVAAAGAVLVLLTAWSRVELKQHSLAQVVAGILVAILIILAVFYLFGLV